MSTFQRSVANCWWNRKKKKTGCLRLKMLKTIKLDNNLYIFLISNFSPHTLVYLISYSILPLLLCLLFLIPNSQRTQSYYVSKCKLANGCLITTCLMTTAVFVQAFFFLLSSSKDKARIRSHTVQVWVEMCDQISTVVQSGIKWQSNNIVFSPGKKLWEP